MVEEKTKVKKPKADHREDAGSARHLQSRESGEFPWRSSKAGKDCAEAPMGHSL